MPRAKQPSGAAGETKRQNFNITPDQEAEIIWLRQAMHAATTKDLILRAVRVLAVLVREAQRGHRLYVGAEPGKLDRLIIPELEPAGENSFKYLVERPHAWRRQMYVKGRRLLASTVWSDLIVNQLSIEEAAENWDLPTEAIEEIVSYCESNRRLLEMEADEEAQWLEKSGQSLRPTAALR